MDNSKGLTKDDMPRYTPGIVQLPAGWTAKVETEFDEFAEEPWKMHDGHGPVSEWTHRDKHAGERVLHRDGNSYRYYDFAGAMKQARKEEWGCEHGLAKCECHTVPGAHGGHRTDGEVLACAVEQDFQRMKAWCEDRWHWIGVVVTLLDAEGEEVESESTWGIEDDTDYWQEVAADLINDLASGRVLPVHYDVPQQEQHGGGL